MGVGVLMLSGASFASEAWSTSADFQDVDWKNVEHHLSDKVVPFEVVSFDLECDSSHGDFPLAKKDYLNFATELVDLFINRNKQLVN